MSEPPAGPTPPVGPVNPFAPPQTTQAPQTTQPQPTLPQQYQPPLQPAYGQPTQVIPQPPPGYSAATPGNPSPAKPGAGGLAIASLAVGIASLVLCWVPFLGVIGAAAGLVLGIIAWVRASNQERPQGMAIGGTVVSSVALLASIALTIIVLAVLGSVWGRISDCFDRNLTSDQQSQCLDNRLGDSSQQN
jgi:hypothetical protein